VLQAVQQIRLGKRSKATIGLESLQRELRVFLEAKTDSDGRDMELVATQLFGSMHSHRPQSVVSEILAFDHLDRRWVNSTVFYS
jgi:hypothetical protein